MRKSDSPNLEENVMYYERDISYPNSYSRQFLGGIGSEQTFTTLNTLHLQNISRKKDKIYENPFEDGPEFDSLGFLSSIAGVGAGLVLDAAMASCAVNFVFYESRTLPSFVGAGFIGLKVISNMGSLAYQLIKNKRRDSS